MTTTIEKQDTTCMAIEAEYSDRWETVITVDLPETDTYPEITGIWLVAGVPDYLRGTAQAAGSNRGLEQVRVYGDSPAMWCPDLLLNLFATDPCPLRAAAAAVISACEDAALTLHRERLDGEVANDPAR